VTGSLLSGRAAIATVVAGLVVALAQVLAGTQSPRVPGGSWRSLGERLSTETSLLRPVQVAHLAMLGWQGGPTTATDGETLTVNVSDSIPEPDAVRQRWANFFVGLVHGSELQLLTVYVVPAAEVGADCGGDPNVLGCYGSQQLIVPNETVLGVPPEEVARHEYGHHIANNRLNAPWQAIDWGPKRWATQMNVCSSTQQGLTFPGSEDDHYRLNPGEGWAETYRALNDTKAGLPITWQVVDARFYPDQAALAAAEQDVVAPWAAPTSHGFRGAFRAGKTKWKVALATPLDGELRVTLSLPRPRLYRLTVLSGDGATVLASGLWSGTTTQTASFTVCDQRSLLIQVTGDGKAGRFTLRTTQP
jgi:hypothetical protein